ncbi:MAG: DUF4123 domain-containing protein [Pseudomonadota bacterium]
MDAHPETRVIEGIEPLSQPPFGMAPDRTVPEPLQEVLFGQLPDGSIPSAWALLDAARIPQLPDRIERSGLPYACLFTNAAKTDLGDVAPWLVELRDGDEFPRELFTEVPGGRLPSMLGGRIPGLLVRAEGPCERLWQHLRKFTRLRDARENWHFLRFWEPRSAFHYLAGPHPLTTSLLSGCSAIVAV